MATPFSKAWNLLKYFKNPHDEEASYGDTSMRNHPLFGMPGYEGTSRDQPTEREMAEMADPQMMSLEEERPMPVRNTTPPNPFEGERGSIHSNIDNQLEEYLRQEDATPQPRRENTRGPSPMKDAGRPQTIPMSPRVSVRGRGERQSFDKPKKPDWWRTLSGE